MSQSQDITVTGTQLPALAGKPTGHGGLEGAERTQRETVTWTPHMGSPDQIINRVKHVADARGRDMVNNDGYAHGAVGIHKDSIVGGHYRLNAKPVLRVLQGLSKSFDEVWFNEFREMVEARFDLIGESDACYLDASGMNTFTDMVRLAVGGIVIGGEVFATAEWLSRDRTRPLATAIQMIAAARVSNPDGLADTALLRRGIVRNMRGKPEGYWIRMRHPSENYDLQSNTWRYVAARKPWGRRQVIHIYEQQEPDQSRGIGDIVSVLKNMRMTKQFDELTLQNAVVNASYASAIESDLPPDAVYGMMGGASGPENFENGLMAYMGLLAAYFGAANNVAIDGVKTPVLPPGTKLTTKTLGTPGGVGSDFGEQLLRHTAAGLGLSGEEFMNNFTKTSYSGLRGAFSRTEIRMKAKKKTGADRFANAVYALMLEEEIGNNNVPLPRGVSNEFFYEPLMKEAICKATWIGSGSGQIDELKETQAAILRIKSGLSTYERESAKLGEDYRDVFAQRAREEGVIAEYGLAFSLDTQRPGKKDPQNTLSDDPDSGTQNEDLAEGETRQADGDEA